MKKVGIICLTLLIALTAAGLYTAKASVPETVTYSCEMCGNVDRQYILCDEWETTDQYHRPVYMCSVCHQDKIVFLSISEDHYGGTATCTEKAICAACHQPYGDEPKYDTHDLVHHDAQAATCTEIGWDAYDTCTRCTYTTYKEIAPHHDIVHHDAQAATCTEDGWEAYDTCKNCTYTTYKKISALNHDTVPHEGKAATCTEDGWEAYDTCTRCTYTTYKKISALGHDVVPHEGKAATCTEIGWEAYETCTRCTYTTYKEISALEHDWHFEKTVKPTCEADGYTLYACSRCPETDTRSPVSKLGHWFGEWTPNGNEAHTAECRRSNCSHAAAVGCERYEYTVNGESLTLCPVCGEAENAERLEWLEGVSAPAFDDSLPEGELVARRNASCLSLVFEYAGKVTEFEGEITFTLPAEALNGASLVLVSPDGTETPLSLKEENGAVSFTLDFTGMALLRLVFEV